MEYAREDKHIMNIPRKKKKQNVSWNRNEKRRLNSEQYTIENLKLAYKHIEASQVNSFKDFPLSFKTLKGLKECGYIKPTEIQRESIGLSLFGSDVLGAAKTGSGKTLAFLIPVLELLYCKQWTRLDGVGALIITPTRELAYQIFEMLRKVGHFHDVSAGLIIGGKDLHFEKKRLDQCNIVICTPGRLLQHMDENPLFNCDNLQILVLDEADRCLDLGFEATMNNIIENLPPKRQTLLFSATQTKSVRDLARLSLKDPMYVSVHEHAKYSTPESLRQSYVVCELHEKINMLWSFIRNHLKQKILVFMSSCKQVKYCYEMFCRLRPGSSLLALYGTLHQLRRMAIYESFCRKSNVVMFATDIAARGLDFPEVNWVVQLDCPEDANTYIHRAGRTARYHKGGESVLVLLPSEEEGMIEELAAKKIPISKIKLNPAKLQSPQRKMEALLARDPSLKESAQRAFVSYMKSVFLMKNKKVFKVHLLDAELYSRSLGLAVPPRIRFLQKLLKQQGQETSKLEDGTIESNKVSEVDEQESGNSSACSSIQDTDDIRQVPDSFNFENGDSDSDVDILKVKRKDHELDIGIPLTDEIPENTKNKKAVTKVAVAKKILKKKIIANKKIIFNNEGEAVLHPTKDKISDIAREYENEVKDGIDIEEARKVLREEDKYDKQRFREKIKAKHREEKLKLKKARNEERKEEAEEEIDGGGGDDDDDEESVPDLSWLPDPDKVFPSEERESKSSQTVSDDDDTSDSNSSEEELNQKHKSVSLKRKKSYSTRRKRQKTEFSENNPSLKEDEELALQLLKSVK